MPWFFYIVSNANKMLYSGITTDPLRRYQEHRSGKYPNGFTKRYNFDKLVYVESCGDQKAAALRERRVKRWVRAKRVALIESMNPEWKNLAANDWIEALSLDDDG